MQEQPAILRNGLRAREQVLERGRVRARRVIRLLRLLELLRIAEQHEVLGARGHREHVRERHLPGLVDEQHVDAVAELGPSPSHDVPPSSEYSPRKKRAARSLSSTECSSSGSPAPLSPLCRHLKSAICCSAARSPRP
jgi:hypothetical protein